MIFLDVLLDSAIDTLKLIPFLFVTYFLMEYVEHKTSEQTKENIEHAGKLGPVIGGLLGIVPQCGFSASAANLFAGRVISVGTLIAIFLSTSDEMLPILVSERVPLYFMLKVLLIKVVIGIAAGIVVDLVYDKMKGDAADHHEHIHEVCEHDHCNCEKNIFVSALIHTLQITIYIFIFTLIISLIIEFVGEDKISAITTGIPVLGEVIAGLIGLIPNCASSVALTTMYLEGVISFGAMMSGLLVGAGVGVFVLFKSNHHVKENLAIVGILYAIGVVSGCIINLF